MTGFKFIPPKKAKIDKAINSAFFAAAEQIMNDCNTYIKHLEGDLENSSQHTVDGNRLEVSWHTPYAKRQYYTGTPSATSLQFHPKASIMWADKAEKEYRKDWLEILAKGFSQGL